MKRKNNILLRECDVMKLREWILRIHSSFCFIRETLDARNCTGSVWNSESVNLDVCTMGIGLYGSWFFAVRVRVKS